MQQHRIEKVLVVDGAFSLRGMITVKDILKAKEKPKATKDQAGRLRAGAVGTTSDTMQRVAALVDQEVDFVVVDTAHGHSSRVCSTVRAIKQTHPGLPVIAGNIATADAALALKEAGVDAVKVGIGPGSICTTRIIAGVGVPQISAIAAVAEALSGSSVSIIADGGIRYSGDVAKAIAAGAHVVMIGSLFAGTEESPGVVELYQGRSYKTYRGMGSLGAMAQAQGSKDRYFQDTDKEKLVPEGIEGRVPYKGSVLAVVHQLIGGLRSAMGYTGSADLAALRSRDFIRITAAGVREGHVHDVSITKEAPNYRELKIKVDFMTAAQQHKILILDFGSQYTQLIARAIRALGVYCELHPFDVDDAFIQSYQPKAIVLSGGPESVAKQGSPRVSNAVFDLGVPILGICYGMQTMAAQLGGAVVAGDHSEFGHADFEFDKDCALFQRMTVGQHQCDSRFGMDESR